VKGEERKRRAEGEEKKKSENTRGAPGVKGERKQGERRAEGE
jgi:hypothetical protein